MISRSFLNGRVTLMPGDCREVLATLPEASVDSVVCDPPYHLTSIVKRFGNTSIDGEGTNEKRAKAGADGMARLSRGFMGKQWDGGDVAFQVETWAAVFRVMKPGAHLLAFSGTRTYHRMVCAVEDAGFEIRDQIGFCFGSGFPKSHNVSRNVGDARCACQGREEASVLLQHTMRPVRDADIPAPISLAKERQQVLLSCVSEQSPSALWSETKREEAMGTSKPGMEGRGDLPQATRQLRKRQVREVPAGSSLHGPKGWIRDGAPPCDGDVGRPTAVAEGMRAPQGPQPSEQRAEQLGTLAGQPDAQTVGAWQLCGRCGKPMVPEGLGTALKPAWEPIVLARKPLTGTVAENVLRWGTGALNIDGCRVGTESTRRPTGTAMFGKHAGWNSHNLQNISGGSDLGRWPANFVHDGSPEVLAAFPDSDGGGDIHKRSSAKTTGVYGAFAGDDDRWAGYADLGSAARFFYTSKADAEDRLGSKHPTVKPLDLMQWLVRLVTPRNGVCLDPFAGTGTTGEAAWREGMRAILIEREAEYIADIERRMELADNPTKRAAVAKTKNKLDDPNELPLFKTESAAS